MKLTITGELPALNEIIQAAKTNWRAYNTMKENNTSYIAWQAKKLGQISYADVIITWYCRNKKKDKDNIMAGQKFILDGLREAGVIENDGWKNIRDITHRFEVDRLSPRVEIELKEVS